MLKFKCDVCNEYILDSIMLTTIPCKCPPEYDGEFCGDCKFCKKPKGWGGCDSRECRDKERAQK